jgi:hypothetical protein
MCNTDFSTGICYTSFHMVTSKMYEVHIMKRVKQIYSERITIQDVLIFVYIIVHWNHENRNPAKYNFSFTLLLQVFETTNAAYGSMYFVETTKFGAHE